MQKKFRRCIPTNTLARVVNFVLNVEPVAVGGLISALFAFAAAARVGSWEVAVVGLVVAALTFVQRTRAVSPATATGMVVEAATDAVTLVEDGTAGAVGQVTEAGKNVVDIVVDGVLRRVLGRKR